MAKRKERRLSEEKRNLIVELTSMYDIKTAKDIQEALKDLLGSTLQTMLEAELEEQITESKEADSSYRDSRNGYKPKTLRSSLCRRRWESAY